MISFDNIKIHERPYDKLINLLGQETKLNFFYYRRNFIERRIKSRMIRTNCYTLKSYYNYILANKDDEIKKFLDNFNINYSYFFRNWEVFDLFQTLFLRSLNVDEDSIITDLRPNPLKIRKKKAKSKKKKGQKRKVVPHNNLKQLKIRNTLNKPVMIKDPKPIKRFYSENSISYLKLTSLHEKVKSWKKKQNPINIWSCPCASGEEPYSIAMILDNLRHQIPDFPDYDIKASDIDQEALIKAKNGIYSKESTKDISSYFENRYFSKTPDYFGYKYLLKKEIMNQVHFIKEDITKWQDCKVKFDVIFFRYLLIYFDRENRNNVIKIIENQLRKGGLLFLGKTETLFNSESALKLVDSRDHIYMKQ